MTISNLQSSVCETLITAIHNKTFFGKRLYCNGIVPLTPKKQENEHPASPPPASNSSQDSQTDTSPVVTTATSTASTITTSSSTSPLPDPVSPMSPNTFSQRYSETPDVHHLQLQPSNEQLVRRNSVSLRSPPLGSGPYLGSLADELLSSETPKPANHYEQARTILSNLKEMSERFSDIGDFASCNSTTSGEDTDMSETDNEGFRKQGKGKRKKGRKHRLSTTPGKEHFMKKANLSSSPQ